MPLVDLQTNLKSLKYGRDRLNGGSSGEPYVTKDIVGPFSGLHRTGGSDLLIRGGFLLGDRIADDVKRLGKYFSSTEGILWATTQNVLSETGVRIYGGYPKAINAFPGGGLGRLNDGTYLPTSTLAQLATNPFGGHLNKQGTDPTGLTIFGRPEYLKLQRDIKTANLALGGDQEINRLLKLRKDHITSFSDGPLYSYLGGPGAGTKTGGPGKTSIRFADQRTPTYQKLNNPYFQTTSENIFSKFVKTTLSSNLIEVTTYGVSSTYGLDPETANLISKGNGFIGTGEGTFGQSVINSNEFQNRPLNPGKLADRGAALNIFDPEHKGIVDRYIEGYKKDYKVESSPEFDTSTPPFDLPIPNPEEQKKVSPKAKETQIQDFRATKKNRVKAPDYTNKKLEKRVLLGNPGDLNIDRTDYTKSSKDGQDKINNLYLYKSSAVAGSKFTNDLVKFRIATIDPDEPSKAVFTHFRAFINGMSDNFSAEWDSFKYMGRGESFYNYQGFQRSMRLNWTVMAQSKYELSTQYQKLNYLASTLAPNYSAAGFMRGNIHRLTIGGYVYEYPGIIESLDFTVPDDSPWEIGINTVGGFDTNVKELPHRIEVAMSFKPISTFLPATVGSPYDDSNKKGINGAGAIKQRFISLEDDGANNNLYYDGTNNSVKVS